jgi:IS30 family transposase
MERRMSHETIYQYIWRDKAAGGQLWRYLRQLSICTTMEPFRLQVIGASAFAH